MNSIASEINALPISWADGFLPSMYSRSRIRSDSDETRRDGTFLKPVRAQVIEKMLCLKSTPLINGGMKKLFQNQFAARHRDEVNVVISTTGQRRYAFRCIVTDIL